VIDERLNWHTGSLETRCAAHAAGLTQTTSASNALCSTVILLTYAKKGCTQIERRVGFRSGLEQGLFLHELVERAAAGHGLRRRSIFPPSANYAENLPSPHPLAGGAGASKAPSLRMGLEPRKPQAYAWGWNLESPKLTHGAGTSKAQAYAWGWNLESPKLTHGLE